MATNIGDQNIGNLNLFLKQGNTKTFTLSFYNRVNGVRTPIDLTQYSSIKMDVKSKVNINTDPFISWYLDYGLTISGDDNNVLSFTFDEEFKVTQQVTWYYDILFTDVNGNNTLVGGTINDKKVVTG